MEEKVKRILKRLLSRDFAVRISFTGKGNNNIAFSQYKNVLSVLTGENDIRSEALNFLYFYVYLY